MTPADVEATVRRVLKNYLDRDVEMDKPLREQGANDALTVCCILFSLGEYLNIALEDGDMLWVTGNDLLRDCHARVAALGAAQEPQR